MAEWNVWADTGKNRLYVVLRGYFSDEEARTAADLCIATAEKLTPGFDCITDLTTHKPGSAVAVGETLRAQKFMVKRGMQRVVRIVTSSALSKLQFERTGKQAGYQDEVLHVATSITEAERKLDESA